MLIHEQKSDTDVVGAISASTAINGIPFTFSDLLKATSKCKKDVIWKDSVAGFVKNRLINCLRLMEELQSGTYRLSRYSIFKIYEPKERTIVATGMRDRVVQRALCDTYLYKQLTKGFIYDNWACQIGKGTTKCRKRLAVLYQKFYRKHGTKGYILKLDIKNYFGSTPHEVAKAAIAKRVDNEWVKNYVFTLIDSFAKVFGKPEGIGLGSQISQLIELSVLDDLDHFIKEKLKVKYYMRYMDDMLLISESKEQLNYYKKVIVEELAKLGLKISEKKTTISKLTQNIHFLGFSYRLTETGHVDMRLIPDKFSRERTKLRKQSKIFTRRKLHDSFIAWKSNAKQGDTYKAIQKMNAFYYTLERKTYVKINYIGKTCYERI